jgi:hypothetical protein
MVIRCDEGKQTELISNCLGGKTVTSQTTIEREELKLKGVMNHSGHPLEWIEIHIV